jgi:putative redox protein
MRMYAAQKQWPLQQVQVTLSHARVHADDCANCEAEAALVDQIDVEVRLTGALSDEQRKRLLAIAEKCPIQRRLSKDIRIRTQLAV